VREAPLNEVIGPVETEFGFHIIEVTARETQPLTENEIGIMHSERREQFEVWLAQQIAAAQIDRSGVWPDVIPAEPHGIDLLREMLTEPVE
jgi:parvulin-like peptidyl-prolyl isomerase